MQVREQRGVVPQADAPGLMDAGEPAAQLDTVTRGVTIGGEVVLFDRGVDGSVQLVPNAVEHVRTIVKGAPLHIICQASSDAEEEVILTALQPLVEGVPIPQHVRGLIHGLMQAQRILFHEKLEGRVAMVRQLNPVQHLEGKVLAAQELERFAEGLVFFEGINATEHYRFRDSVQVVDSLETWAAVHSF